MCTAARRSHGRSCLVCVGDSKELSRLLALRALQRSLVTFRLIIGGQHTGHVRHALMLLLLL